VASAAGSSACDVVVEPDDGQRAIDTIVLAFAADPVERCR
jgi:hypothetical protein